MLASVTSMLASREHCNSRSTSSSTAVYSASNCQCSSGQPASPPLASTSPLLQEPGILPARHHLRLPAEARQMLTAAVQSSRFCCPVYDRHTAHLWPGRRICRCATILWCTDRIAGQWQRALNTPGVNYCTVARETVNPWYHSLHLLWHVCQEIWTVRSSSPTAPNVPIHPWSVAPRLQSNGKAGCTVFCVARRAKGLPHLGTCLPVLQVLQSLQPHSHSIGRLYTACSPFPACPHRPRGAPSDVSGLHVLLHCSQPFHPLVRSPVPHTTSLHRLN
jgi:hypothetical protein